MESNTNNISSAGLHGLDQRQRRILRLLKRTTYVRGRMHLVVCRCLPVWRRATIARSAIVARIYYFCSFCCCCCLLLLLSLILQYYYCYCYCSYKPILISGPFLACWFFFNRFLNQLFTDRTVTIRTAICFSRRFPSCLLKQTTTQPHTWFKTMNKACCFNSICDSLDYKKCSIGVICIQM